MKIVKKISLILFTFIIVIVLVFSFLPSFFHEDIERLGHEELDKQLQADVSFEHLHLSWWKHFPDLAISMETIAIASADVPGDTLLKADGISFGVDYIEFLTDGHLAIKTILIEKPVLKARVFQNGKANFSIFKNDTTTSKTEDGYALSFHVKKIKIENASLSYADDLAKTIIHLAGLDLVGKGDFSNEVFDLNTVTKIPSASVTYNGNSYFSNKKIDFSLKLNVNKSTSALRFERSTIGINNFSFGFNGDLKYQTGHYEVDLKFNSPESTFKDILSLVPALENVTQGITTDGTVKFDGFMKGDYHPGSDTIPVFEVNFNVTNASLKVDTLPNAIEDIQVLMSLHNDEGLLDSTHLDLDSLHFRIEDHKIHAHAHVSGLTNPLIDGNIEGTLHFKELLNAYPLRGVNLDGEIKFDMEVMGRYEKETPGKAAQYPHVDFNVDIAHGKLKYDSFPDSLSNISLRLQGHSPQGNWENTSVVVEQLRLRSGDNTLEGSLKWEGLSTPRIEGAFTTAVDLEDIMKIFPLKGNEIKGLLKVDALVNGIYDRSKNIFPKVDAQLTLSKGYFKSGLYPEPVEDIELQATIENKTGEINATSLNVNKLGYSLEGEPFQVSGSVKDFKNYAYDVSIQGAVDLSKISKIFPMEGVQLAGKIISDMKLSGTLADLEAGNYTKTKANGSVTFKNISVASAALPQAIIIENALFELQPQLIKLKNLNGRAGRSSFLLDGELSNYLFFITANDDLVTGNLKLLADTLDLTEWKSAFVTTQPTTPTLKATAPAPASAWKVPLSIDFDFMSDLKFVRFEDMKINDMKGDIRIKDGIITLTESGFNSLNARFSVDGIYDSRNIAHPMFDLQLSIEDLDIQKAYKELKIVRDLAPAAADASGHFSINYSLKGELDSLMYPKTRTLTGNGVLEIAEAKINGMKIFQQLSKTAKKNELNDPHLKNFVMVTEIRDNKLFVKPFELNVSGWNAEIEGVNNINGTINYLVKVEMVPLLKVKIPFNVTGNYSDPKVALGKGQKLPE